MMRSILIAGLLLLVAAYFFVTSTTTTNLSAYLGRGEEGRAECRTKIVEFARTHDWKAELVRSGISIPPALVAQVIAPLGVEPLQDDSMLVRWEVRIVFRSVPETVLGPEQMDRACRLVQARLSTESDIIRASLEDRLPMRRALLWEIYGSGFDERAREFFAEHRATDPDPELRALSEEFYRRLPETR